MKSKKIYISDKEWFESSSLKNPITTLDHNLEKYYPEFYNLNYDTKLLVTNPPSHSETTSIFYNPYREVYGTNDIRSLEIAIRQAPAKNIFLNGFQQEHFDYIAPLLKSTTRIIYFYKCHKISDLSILSQFPELECVHIFYNSSLISLWDMANSTNLKAISFTSISKLTDIETLKHSHIEYIHLDSMDNNGQKKPALFDIATFEQIPKLKYLSLNFTNCETEKAR